MIVLRSMGSGQSAVEAQGSLTGCPDRFGAFVVPHWRCSFRPECGRHRAADCGWFIVKDEATSPPNYDPSTSTSPAEHSPSDAVQEVVRAFHPAGARFIIKAYQKTANTAQCGSAKTSPTPCAPTSSPTPSTVTG